MLKPKLIEDIKPFGKSIVELHPDAKTTFCAANETCRLVSHDESDEEEVKEIYWKGRTVVIMYFDKHSNDFKLKNCFSVDTDVKDVLYANFHMDEKSSGLSSCLCILEKGCLNVFTEVGNLFIASLPFKVKRIWAIQNGICVEREATSKDSEYDKGMPTLFSLTHPLEDFKPVVYQYQDNRKPMYFTDATQNIVFTSPSKSYIMTYDSILGLHSIWKVRKALEQDFPEVASHQDSLPEFLGFNNHSSSTLAPLKSGPSRLSMSPAVHNKRHSCPPIPMHLQPKASPGRHGSPMSKPYSPINQNYKGTHHGHHEAHDASITSEINGSKRSHINSMMMFRMSCADTKLEEEVEPLPPNVCLEQVWQEQGNMIRYGTKGKSESGFLTYDFYGTCYLGYLIKGLSKLRLLRVYQSKFEKVIELDCIDAGSLKPCKMFVVMDFSHNLFLYSGKQKIMSVSMPEVFTGSDVKLGTLSLKQFANGGFNVVDNSGKATRLHIPNFCHFDLVYSCIEILKDILNNNEYNLVASKYYSKFHEENGNENLWEDFIQTTLKLLGFPESSIKSLKENVRSPAPPEPKKAKKSSSFAGYEDWVYLLSCRPNRYIDDDDEGKKKKYIADISLQKNAPLYQHITNVFSIWHQHYEELKLNTMHTNLEEFAKFLHYMAINGMSYILSQHENMRVFSSTNHAEIYERDYPTIKSKMDTLYHLKEEFKDISVACQSLKNLSIHNFVMNSLTGQPTGVYKQRKQHKYSTVVTKIFHAISKYTQKACSDTEHLLSQLKLGTGDEPLIDVIINIMIREDFTPDDLEKLPIGYKIPIKEILHHHKNNNQSSMNLQTAMFLGREDVVALKQFELTKNQIKKHEVNVNESDDTDGMLFDDEILFIRYNEDLRVNEVKRLLNSSEPINVNVEQKPDVNDHAFAKEEEAKLLVLSKRTMSLSVARGMLTMGTSQPDSSKAVSIPPLDLSGRSTNSNKTVQIPQTDLNAAQLLWPQFHNGVAAGLKIARGECQIDSTWILLNKLKCSDLNASHSGFLFALGLMGHVASLPKLYLHDYLIKGHELTTVALLIGLAATKIGTKNTDTYKLLCLHLETLLPPTALELNIPKTSQTASTISLGLLFFGTADMHLVKVLLHEIGKPPGPEIENSSDRESHALSAGLALGMIMIGKGTDQTKVLGADIFSLLYSYVNRGKKKDLFRQNFEHNQPQQASSQIHEGDVVNTDVTAPAAIMALALMYLKTNNYNAANAMKVTVVENTLDTLKPDHVLYRMLSYNLIMWDFLVPTNTWISELVPQYNQLLETLGGSSLQLVELKEDLHYHICVISGSFLALSIKFAGSFNSNAFNLMFPWLKIIRKVSDTSFCDEIGCRVVLEQCLNTILIALSILMAGSGNIKILRAARQLRKRSLDVSYGSQMSIHMAIGFLFLGGGRYTLKTDNVAVACLLCSVYPKWPVSSKDNRFHLQALRHLYVLACEPRLFVTRDVDSKEICYTPIQITLKETQNYPETSYKVLSPCFIPEQKNIKSISTLGPRYWPVTLSAYKKNSKLWLEQIQNVYVKKKAGYLSYAEDPKGYRNLLGRTFTNQSEKLECIKAFSSATNVVLFEEMFCMDKENNNKEKTTEFFSNILYECVRKEKLDVMDAYLSIEKIVRDIENNEFSIHGFLQLCLLINFYSHMHPKLVHINAVDKEPLMNDIYLMQCHLRSDNHIQTIKRSGFERKRALNFHVIEELNNGLS